MVEVQDNEAVPTGTYTSTKSTYAYHSDSLTITEEQAGEIVRQVGDMYEDYEYPEDLYVRAVRSYRSLLRSLNINSRVINLVRI
jgi:hypothetical protein